MKHNHLSETLRRGAVRTSRRLMALALFLAAAAAHAVANGFARLSLSPAMHGELAAFGTLVQLVLEKDQAELPRVMEFCRHVGLPVCLEDLGCGQLGEEMLLLAAEKACAPEFSMGNMPFAVTPEELCRAILTLNPLARE